jgi:hypothetical protein
VNQPEPLIAGVSAAFIDWRAVVRLILRRQERFLCSLTVSYLIPQHSKLSPHKAI